MTHIEKMKQWLEVLEEAVHYTSAPVWSPSMTKECNEAITSLRQAIAEAEKQEPYAYTYLGIKNDGSQHGPHLCWKPEYMDVMSHSKGAIAVPLYTAPQPQREWVGLTDEEILSDDTLRYYYGMNGGAGPVSQKGKKVIAAIEAKLKEKNGYNT